MADTVTDQNEILEMNPSADDSSRTVTVIRAADTEGTGEDGVNEEFILQEAFGEASEALTDADAGKPIQIHYTTEGGVELHEGDIIDTPDGPVRLVISNGLAATEESQTDENYNNNGYQVVTATSGDNLYEEQHIAEAAQQEAAEHTDTNVIPETSELIQNVVPVQNSASNNVMQMQDMQPHESILSRVPQSLIKTEVVSDGSPLGSSTNPIRIIQQGNQYIPVQQLSTDQLQQIMQVVQQQQLTKQSADTGSSVLFNPQTNTRIVYRVIYPSELHKDGDNSKIKEQEQNSGQEIVQVLPKRQYKRRQKEEDEEKIDAPELSKEEKEARKKQRLKTRSGRVSKPPKHMVKDFKHIHVLDYDEDYDDSDGGYSDFKASDHEDDESSRSSSKKDEDASYLIPGIGSLKPKKWKCSQCGKAYIGRAGLSRHLTLYPDHGKLEPGSDEMEPSASAVTPTDPDAENSNTYSEDAANTSVTPTLGTVNGVTPVNGVNSAASMSEDSRDSSSSISYTPKPRGRGMRGRPPWKGRGRGRGSRGHYNIDPDLRRRNKLKEIVRDSLDEELMEIVLPRLTQVITLWEFLLMKVEKGNPTRPHADDIYKEYLKLHDQVKRLCQEYLECLPSSEAPENDNSVLTVEDSAAAAALGLTAGTYRVKEISEDDSTYDYKLITTSQRVMNNYSSTSFLKRTVEVVSPQELVSPSKKAKISEDVKSKIMPVSFSDKLKGLTAASACSVQNPPGKVIVVSQPSQLSQLVVSHPNRAVVSQPNKVVTTQANQQTVLVNSNGEVISAKPGFVFINANHMKSQQTLPVIAGPVTSNMMVPVVNKVDLAKTKQPAQKSMSVVPTMRTPNNSLLNPDVGTPLAVLNQPIANPVSLLKPGIIPTSDTQKFFILSGSKSPESKQLNLGEIQQANKKKPKQVILDTGQPPFSSPFVNASSQVQQSLITSQTSSDIIVQTTIPQTSMSYSSTFGTNTFVLAPGSSDVILPLNGQGLGNGNSQQPINYIALPFSQPSQPQMSVPSFGNQLPGTVVLQSVVNGNMSTILNGTTNVTNETSAIIPSASDPPQPSNILQIIESAENGNQRGYQVLAELESANVDPVNNHIEETTNIMHMNDANSNLSNSAIINEQLRDIPNGNGAVVMSQEQDQNILLNSVAEQSDQVVSTNQQNNIDDVTSNVAVMNEVNSNLSEQMDELGTVPNAGDNGSVINSIDPSGAQLHTTDTDMSVLDGESGLPADTSETVQMETGEAEETIQMPATNIFQTEDGLIFIQNPDGTTIQLQSSDGQNIPLETIQALLSMDGETQLIAEQSEDTQLTEQSQDM